MAGVLRVFFFLAVAVLAVTVVVSGVTTLYDAPSEEAGEFEGFEDVSPSGETADYNRNVGLILGLIGAGTIASGLLGLGSRFNPLRTGLLAGGVGLVLGGVGLGSTGSDDWLTFLTSSLALATLLGSSLWLDEGLVVWPTGGGSGRGPGTVSDTTPAPREGPFA
jgi:hypothetical protein